MKKLFSICIVVIVIGFLFFLPSCQTKSKQNRELPKSVSKTLFKSKQMGYYGFRTPILLAYNDFVIALCEGRKNGLGDHGEIDIVARISLNAGKKWEPITTIFTGEQRYSNPSGIIIPISEDSFRIILLFSSAPQILSKQDIINANEVGQQTLLVSYSDDMGKNWSTPKNITDMLLSSEDLFVVASPSSGVYLSNEGCALFSGVKYRKDGQGCSTFLFCTKDGGEHFEKVSDIVGDVEGVALAKMGGNLFAMLGRAVQLKGASTNLFFGITDTISQPITLTQHEQLEAPACSGSLAVCNDDEIFLLFPYGDERKNLVLVESSDKGLHFEPRFLVYSFFTGFSSMVSINNQLLVAFEAGRQSPYQEIRVATLSTSNSK